MPKADNLTIDNSSISLLFKGPYGYHKTCSAVTFALEGPIFLAYIDKNQPIELDHFFRRILKRPEALKNIEYECYSSKNINQYVNKLMEFVKYCDKIAIITDSATNFTTAAVNWSLGFRNSSGPKKDPLAPDSLRFTPDWDEYKIETSMITQALDLQRAIKTYNIWTAHPITSIDMGSSEGGKVERISKVKKIVSYGSKVGEIIPGQFSEVYHFSTLNQWNPSIGKATVKRLVSPVGIGDDFAKSNLGLTEEMDITDRPFYEVWKDQINKLKKSYEDSK